MDLKNKERWVTTLIFAIGIILLSFDIAEDFENGASLKHMVEEGTIVLLSMAGMATLWMQFFRSKIETRTLRQKLTESQQDFDKYKRETAHLVGDLNAKIHEQFSAWHFTEAEKQIALLALKGLSVKEIATARETSEKTVTQQLSSIYQKSKLHGRSELAAYFLEDLFTE